jgi:hypothetical protein
MNTNNLKKCRNGHLYQGEQCPYCPTQFYGTTLFSETTENSVVIPKCLHCGNPVRKGIPMPDNYYVGSIEGNAYDGKTPWNYGWDGKCDNCGQDYNISMRQIIPTYDFGNDKITTVKIKEYNIMISCTGPCSIGLSGVEIKSRIGNGSVQTIFLSTNELKYLMNILKNSPILKQLDSNQSMY